ncbi:hypothetical protein B0H16DRAFT_1804604 [Mycena metata]|uniref:Novel STAND NTPase 1 domain-containing protein n=1 Tax=Mycena metata TaxID=1033252 RepID=A0AAD7JIJ1_9AGAR|nr:hypothetical protein B0H16DRAFT_1804604 [Mycena metata]
MPRSPTITEIRLKNVSKCVTITVNTLEVLVNTIKISGLEAVVNTTQSLLGLVETIKQGKDECTELMEQAHMLLNAIIGVYVKSDTGAELPPSVLGEIAKFTETLHKIHTFVETQQSGNKVKQFFRHGELSALLKGCRTGLQQGVEFFQIKSSDTVLAAWEMEKEAQLRYQEVLNMIAITSASDSASSISQIYSGSYASSNSISMLPAEPKIFHGRESELAEILKHFGQGTPRIAILGTGGMGKTSLAKTVLHHEEITAKYQGNCFFVPSDGISSKVELANLIGAHLGMKAGKDLTRAILQHFSGGPPSLLILDNLETVWEPAHSRKEIEELLSLLTDIPSLALMVCAYTPTFLILLMLYKITMRGAERPSKVQWTRPFLSPLKPLSQEAARKMFIDIAEDRHSMKEMDQVLALTDNMPLSINLLAHIVDVQGCNSTLLRWQEERTSVISEGYDRRSNLELSISLSLASPRITVVPRSQDLLSLLSILPDGLSDVELKQTAFPIEDILACKMALVRTALAYTDDQKRLKALVPIREYMARLAPPRDHMVRPLLKHYHQLLELYQATRGTRVSTPLVDRLVRNYTNMQNTLRNALHPTASTVPATLADSLALPGEEHYLL